MTRHGPAVVVRRWSECPSERIRRIRRGSARRSIRPLPNESCDAALRLAVERDKALHLGRLLDVVLHAVERL